MSAGVLIRPSAKNSSICLSPRPSMSKALREQKCFSPSTACAGQTSFPGAAAHDVGLAGLLVDLAQSRRAADRADLAGIRRASAPAAACRAPPRGSAGSRRRRAARPPCRRRARPCALISSSLCSVALETTTPPTVTGFSLATGVSAPVRPTLISIASTIVVACSAGNLCATAQRGERDTKPSRCCRRGRRPCRRRRRCRSRASRAAPRWRGNAPAFRRPFGTAWSAD